MDTDMIVDEQGRMHPATPDNPRFSHLFNTVLGSPFVTVSELPRDSTWTEVPVVRDDLETVDGAIGSVPRAHTITRPTSPTPSFSTDTYSFLNWPENIEIYSPQPRPSLSDAAPHCSFLPAHSRRSGLGYYPYSFPAAPTPYNSLRFPHPSAMKPSKSFGLIPRLWDVLRESSPGRKGKRRAELSSISWNDSDDGYVDYANMPPLDGEEGELIDDEACFINARAVTGLDIVAHIPQELALYLFTYLDLQDVLSCQLVSRCVFLNVHLILCLTLHAEHGTILRQTTPSGDLCTCVVASTAGTSICVGCVVPR